MDFTGYYLLSSIIILKLQSIEVMEKQVQIKSKASPNHVLPWPPRPENGTQRVFVPEAAIINKIWSKQILPGFETCFAPSTFGTFGTFGAWAQKTHILNQDFFGCRFLKMGRDDLFEGSVKVGCTACGAAWYPCTRGLQRNPGLNFVVLDSIRVLVGTPGTKGAAIQ